VILTGSQPWDVLAGALMVEEAGGRITDYCGNAWTLESEDLIASNAALHQDIISITKETNQSCL
jgi:myo-inositol-1(or 4)-monophosphatase